MKLPNGQNAIINISKLRDYCLNLEHHTGRNKAWVFRAALGLTVDKAELLQSALFEAANTQEAIFTKQNEYGQYYQLDFKMSGPERVATVRSVWLIRPEEDFPALITCYVI